MIGDETFYRLTITAGTASYDASDDVASIVLEQSEGEPDQLRFDLDDPFKVLGHAVQEGMSVELELGAGTARRIAFRGRIYDTLAQLPDGEMPTVAYTAYDASMDMGLEARTRLHRGKLSSIVTQVAQRSGLFTAVELHLAGDPDFGPNGLVQDDETDLELLLRLARTFYCVAYVRPGQTGGSVFHFDSEDWLLRTPPGATLSYGGQDVDLPLIDFEASGRVSELVLPPAYAGTRSDGDPFYQAVPAAAPPPQADACYDANLAAFRKREPQRAARLQGVMAAAPQVRDRVRDLRGVAEVVPLPGLWDPGDVQEIAKCSPATRREGLEARGSVPASQKLTARATAMIEDVGGRFSGKWYLSRVRHSLDERGYLTELSCRR